jgi:4-diphosphocytidyl-2-C-methyl-D-erythritol kinase
MIKEHAYAKINLALDVVKKRADGYHELQMIMMPIELHDTLTFEKSDVLSLDSSVPIENNSVLKAAELMKEKYHIKQGAQIKLEKHIPIGAGLGGGSADIAATLRGLNRLWELNLSLEDLEELALSLGSDTLFCLYNKPAYVFGRGENLLYIDTPKIKDIYLITPHILCSTGQIFKHHKIHYKKHKFEKLFMDYLNEKYDIFFKKSYNSLLKTALQCYPDLKDVYKKVKKIDKYAAMSGSGSTFFMLTFEKKEDDLEQKIIKSGLTYIKTKPKN